MQKTKTIKVTDWVHKEMKIAAAKDGIDLITFTDAAICALLKLRGHKYSPPKQIKK